MHNYKYLQDTYIFNYESKILEIGEYNELKYLVLEDTIFYPQGGGQEADKGFITQGKTKINIVDTRKIDDKILHFTEDSLEKIDTNKEITMQIDKENRILNARLHTAGHLLSNIIETETKLTPTKGHQYQSGSYVECEGDINEINSKLDLLNQRLQENLNKDLKITVTKDKNTKYRSIQIGNYKAVGCGGTHVKSLIEIGEINIRKIKNKKGKIKVSYSISQTST